MAINTNLLVAAPMLQNMLVDKDTGLPLANGKVELWVDTQRYVEHKNWYYQTGTPGAYTYIPLDNPMHLSSSGTIQDPNGNDVIPFYYPYEESDENIPEAYFVTVYSVDSNGDPATLQFTRENFPYMPNNSSPTSENPTWRNYILNNVYWRNVGTLDVTSITEQVIAPSQHEGYTNGDIRFIKNVAGAADSISFLPMTDTLDNDITPENYLAFECNSLQVGETTKCIQYPISLHVKTLQNVQASIVFQGQNVAGNVNNYVDIQVYQYLGSGALSQPDPILIQRVTLNNSWQKFVIPFIFPDASNSVLGEGGDDALFIRVQYPLSATFEINHTKPQLYLSTDVPDNDFDTYDQIMAIINSPRTSDHKISFNPFLPGYVASNDGSIGSSASSATSRANNDTWPLYKLLWEGVLNAWCPVSGGRGLTAYADFTANKPLTLTRNLGRVIAGANPIFTTPVTFTADTGTNILTLASSITLIAGTPVQVVNTGGGLPSPLVDSTIYFVSINSLSSTTIKLSTSLENAYAGVDIDILTAGTGTQTLYNGIGIYLGETNHALISAENGPHTHSLGSHSDFAAWEDNAANVGGGGLINLVRTTFPTATLNSGSGTPHNTMQPTTYGYTFLKL